MSLPALSKTYSSRVNVPFPDTTSVTNNMRSFMFLVKTMLCNQATGGIATGVRNPASVWTVDHSCDGAVAGTPGDGIDRWGTVFDASLIVQANHGTAHSWCVLRNTASNLYLLIDLNQLSSPNQVRVELSQGIAFSGGTTTLGPTPTAVSITAGSNSAPAVTNSAGNITDTSPAGVFRFLSCSFADDGSFRFVSSLSGDGTFTSLFMLHRLVGGHVSDPYPWAFVVSAGSGGRGAASVLSLTVAVACSMRSPNGAGVVVAGGIYDPSFGGAGYVGTYTTDVLTDEYFTLSLPVVSLAPQVAYRGKIPDVYWISAAPVGAATPNSAAQERVVVGDLIIPMPGPALEI